MSGQWDAAREACGSWTAEQDETGLKTGKSTGIMVGWKRH